MKNPHKPRNEHLHNILMSKKGGAHEKSHKAQRNKMKMELAKKIKEVVIQSADVLINHLSHLYQGFNILYRKH